MGFTCPQKITKALLFHHGVGIEYQQALLEVTGNAMDALQGIGSGVIGVAHDHQIAAEREGVFDHLLLLETNHQPAHLCPLKALQVPVEQAAPRHFHQALGSVQTEPRTYAGGTDYNVPNRRHRALPSRTTKSLRSIKTLLGVRTPPKAIRQSAASNMGTSFSPSPTATMQSKRSRRLLTASPLWRTCSTPSSWPSPFNRDSEQKLWIPSRSRMGLTHRSRLPVKTNDRSGFWRINSRMSGSSLIPSLSAA